MIKQGWYINLYINIIKNWFINDKKIKFEIFIENGIEWCIDNRIQSLNYVGSWGGLKDAKQAARLFDMVSAASSFLIKKVSSYISQATREINNNEDNVE